MDKIEKLAFFQFFDRKMGLMPQQWENTNIFAYFTLSRSIFFISKLKKAYLKAKIGGEIMKFSLLTSKQF